MFVGCDVIFLIGGQRHSLRCVGFVEEMRAKVLVDEVSIPAPLLKKEPRWDGGFQREEADSAHMIDG